MTKVFLAGLSCLLVVAALTMGAEASPDTARKKRAASRTIEIRYDDGAVPFVGCPLSGDQPYCPEVRPLPGERFMTVEVIDDVSPRGNLDVGWTSHDGDDPGYFTVCGKKTDTPQKIPPAADITLYPWITPTDDCPTGFSTSGTIKITFTRGP